MNGTLSPFGDFMTALTILAAMAVVYFLPFLVAFARGVSGRYLILFVNGFAGWSVLCWLWALLMAWQPMPKPKPWRIDIDVTVREWDGGKG